MNAHTPTPITNVDGLIYDNNDSIIAKCNTLSNAKYIVHCVNVHDELVACLKSVQTSLTQNKMYGSDVQLALNEINIVLSKESEA